MNSYTIIKLFLLLALVCVRLNAQDWGMYRYVHSSTNIRGHRSTDSKVVGRLTAGQKVKVDYLQDNWYAVFSVNEAQRSEKNALGYIYAPLLRPVPLDNSQKASSIAGGMKYKVVEKKDISYQGTPRMTYRGVIKTEVLPTESNLKETALGIWKNGNRGWKEFTIFIYLPDTDTQSVAYAIAEFRPSGLKEFKFNKWSLGGTKWEQKRE